MMLVFYLTIFPLDIAFRVEDESDTGVEIVLSSAAPELLI